MNAMCFSQLHIYQMATLQCHKHNNRLTVQLTGSILIGSLDKCHSQNPVLVLVCSSQLCHSQSEPH